MLTESLRVPRFLSRNKGFAACVVFSLGVGVSVAAGVVAVVDSALHGPVPFANAGRLEVVYIGGRPLLDRRYTLRPEVVRALTAPGSPFEDVALLRTSPSQTIRDGAREYSGWNVMEVTPNYPRLLSARMHIGRPFGVGDEPDGRYLMFSHEYWTGELASDSSIVGRTVFVDSVPHLVTGVTAQDWAWPPSYVNAWASTPDILAPQRRRETRVRVIGLRKDGIPVGQARAMISAIGTAAMTTRENPGDRIESMAFRRYVTLSLSVFLFALSLAGLFIGFITAVNFAALVLARGLKRRAEIGVRAALGASVSRLMRQIIGETLLLSAAGGVLAAMLAPGVLNVIRLSFDNSLPPWLTIQLTWRVVVASAGIALLLGIIFSIGPALDLARPALGSFLRGAGAGVSGTRLAQMSRAGLVSIQVGLATAFLVLFGAVLGPALVLTRPDPGYDFASIIQGSIARERRGPVPTTAMQVVQSNIDLITGVSHTALVQTRYLQPSEVEFSGAVGDTSVLDRIWNAQVSEAFFDIVRPRVVAGRLPTREESRARAPVAVVSEIIARRTFFGDALGKTIRIGDQSLTVVGVVDRIERSAPSPQASATILSPIVEEPDAWTFAEIWIRVGDPAQVPMVLRDLQQRAGLNLLGGQVRLRSLAVTMRDGMRRFWAMARIVYAIFGVAIVLAAIGIYGLVAYTAETRNREMAIREALGASRARVAAMLLRSAMVQTMIGLAFGAALATGLATQLSRDNFVLDTAAGSTMVAFVIASLTVLASSFGPLRATWRRDLSSVLRD